MKAHKPPYFIFSLLFLLLLSPCFGRDSVNFEYGTKPASFCTSHQFQSKTVCFFWVKPSSIIGLTLNKDTTTYPQTLTADTFGYEIRSIHLSEQGKKNGVGTIWYNTYQDWQNGFRASFNVKVENSTCMMRTVTQCKVGLLGYCFWEKYETVESRCGADGFAFVLQSSSPTAQGQFAGGLGYKMMSNVFAIEFDTWANEDLNDPITQIERHISVIVKPGLASANEVDSIAWNDNPVNFKSDKQEGYLYNPAIKIEYLNHQLRVFINDVLQLAYYDLIDLAKLISIPNSKFYMGLTSSTSAYTQDVEISNWKIDLVVPSPSASSAHLSASNPLAILTNEYFTVDLFVKDACGNRYVPTDLDSVNDVNWIEDSSMNCKLRNVQIGSESGFSETGATYLVIFSCSQVGSETIQLTYKGESIPNFVIAKVSANVLSKAPNDIQTQIQSDHLPDIDTGFTFTLTPEDYGGNLAETTSEELKNKITVIWENPADSRTDHIVTKNKDGTYSFHINTDKAGYYNISSSLFLSEIQGGYYFLKANPGAPNPTNSFVEVYDANLDHNYPVPFDRINVTAGQYAKAFIYLRDKSNNTVMATDSYFQKLSFQLFENGVNKTAQVSETNANMSSLSLLYQMNVKGVNMFQVSLNGNPFTCLNCIFTINPDAANFSVADLLVWSNTSKDYVQTSQFQLQKAATFNFLLVIKDNFGNVINSISSSDYSGTLSGNNMNVLTLLLTQYTNNGVQLSIQNSDLDYYNNLVGKDNYYITIKELSSNKTKAFKLMIVSDGSDSDSSNSNYEPYRTQVTWAVGPTSSRCNVGDVYRVAIKLMTKEGLRYNGWINQSLINTSIDIWYNSTEKMYDLRRDVKPGMYLIDFYITKVTGKLRTLSVKVNGMFAMTRLRFYELAGNAYQAFVDNLQESGKLVMNNATVLKKYTFTYTSFDKFLNPVDPSSVDLILKSSTQPDLVNFKPDCSANGVGVYPCSITPQVAGLFNLTSGLFINGSYQLTVKTGSPDASFSEAGITTNLSQKILAGTDINFHVIVRDSQGSQLAKSEVSAFLANFSLTLVYIEDNTMDNLPLTTVLDSGEITVSKNIQKSGHYKFLPTFNSQDVKCQICAVTIDPNLIDVSKVQVSIIQGDSTARLIENTTVLLDNNRIVPSFIMEFFDTYNNKRSVEDGFQSFQGLLTVPTSSNNYNFNGSAYMGNILFKLPDDGVLKKAYQEELARNNCLLDFEAVNPSDQRRISKKFNATLKGSEFDGQFSYDDPDPNNILIIPNNVQSIAGQYISVGVELRTKDGKLFYDQAHHGFYPAASDSYLPFKLVPDGGSPFEGIQVSNGKLNGTYTLTFKVNTTYSAIKVYLKYLQHNDSTVYNLATNPLVLTVVPSDPNYVQVLKEDLLKMDCKADTKKFVNVKVFDVYNNQIFNADINTLALRFVQDNGTTVPSSSLTADGVQCWMLCKKAGTVNFLSLGFKNSSLQTINNYSFNIVAGDPDSTNSQATLLSSAVKAGESTRWQIFLSDYYGNKISAANVNQSQFWSTKYGPSSLSSKNLTNIQLSNDSSYLYFEVSDDVVGVYKLSAYINGLAIFSSNFLLTVQPLEASWTNCRLAIKDVKTGKFNEWQNVSDVLQQSIFNYPEFKVNLYDNKSNSATQLPSSWNIGVNITREDLDPPLVLCPKNDSITGFVLCEDGSKQRWDELVQNENYTVTMGNKGILADPHQAGLLDVTGNDTDSGTSNLPFDIRNTVINPLELVTEAGVSITFTVEQRTSNKNLRPKSFYKNPMSNISLTFGSDNDKKGSTLNYSIVNGDVRGRYVITIVSFKTYLAKSPNSISLSFDNVPFTNSSVSLIVTPGAIAKVVPYDLNLSLVLTKLPNSTTDNVYIAGFKAFDKWDNNRPISTVDNIDLKLLSNNATLAFQSKVLASGFLYTSFQPQNTGTYTYVVALGGNFSFLISEGSAYFANCLASVNVSASDSVVAGSYVEVSVSFYDRYNNKVNLSPKILSGLLVNYFYKRPDVQDGFIVGTNNSSMSENNSIIFLQTVTVKGIYTFKVSMKDNEVPMKQSTVKVIPAAVNLSMSNLRYFDSDASRYIKMYTSIAIREDNIHTYPSFLLELADSYSNVYDSFPEELRTQINVTLSGNDMSNPIAFEADTIIGSSLFTNISDSAVMSTYRNLVYRANPYNLNLTLLTTSEMVSYPVIMLGEGKNDSDADSGKDLWLNLTVFSKTSLSFLAGEYDTFTIELRDKNNHRKVDANPIFSFSFDQTDGNFKAFVNDGDLRGRYLIAVTGTKANVRTSPAKLSILVNGSKIDQTVSITVSPNYLMKIVIPTNLSVAGSTDKSYPFDVIPYDQYSNVVDVQESDINIQIKYPSNRSTYSTTKDLSTGKLTYSVLCRDVGIYIIQSTLLDYPKNFTVLAGDPSAETSSVYVSPTSLVVGSFVTVTVVVADANNNKILPSKTDVADKFTIEVQFASYTTTLQMMADKDQEKLYCSFSTQTAGVATVVAKVGNNSLHCDSCSVVFTPGPIDISKTKFFSQMLSDSFEETTTIQISYGSSRISFIAYLYDTYGNTIAGMNSSETFAMTLSGNDLEPAFDITVTKQNPNLLLLDLNNQALTRVVPANNYNLNLFYSVANKNSKSKTLTLAIIGPDSDAGNGNWVDANIVPAPTLTVIAGVEGFFDIELITKKNKRFNGELDVSKIQIFDNYGRSGEKNTTTSTQNLTMTVYTGDANGKYRIGILGYATIAADSECHITLIINGTEIPQQLYIQVNPNIPDLALTRLEAGLSESVQSGVVQNVILRFFDTYNNSYQTSDLTNKITYSVLRGQANVSDLISKNVYYLTVPITPIYPPSNLQIMLYYKQTDTIIYPVLSAPLSAIVKTILAPAKTEILGTALPGLSTNQEFKYYVVLKDSAGSCFEELREVVVNFTGPYNNSAGAAVTVMTSNLSYVDANETGLINNSNNSNSTVSFACQKLYQGYLAAESFKKVGIYQIDVYIIGENNNQSVKTINYTVVSAGPVAPQKSILSVPSLLSRGRVPLYQSVNDPLIFSLQLADKFENIIKEYRNDSNVQVSLPDFSDNSSYTFEVTNKSDGSYSLNLTVTKIGVISTIGLTIKNVSVDYANVKKNDVPDTITITPSDCSAQQVIVENSVFKTKNATVGDTYKFILTCRDEFGNLITKGGDASKFQTLMSASNLDVVGVDYAETAITDDNDNGNYTYSFVASWAGYYTVTIQLNGDPVGSPFVIGVNRSKCPNEDAPISCENSDQCAKDYASCGYEILQGCTDSSKPFHCLVNQEMTCVAHQYECDCPQGQSRCSSDLKCVNDELYAVLCSNIIAQECSNEFPYYCDQAGVCRKDQNHCPSTPACPPAYNMCADQTCAITCKTFTVQDDDCPLTTPWKCDDQSCVNDPNECPTRITCSQPGYIICPDKTCAKSELDCRAPAKCTGMYLCPDQSCRPKKDDCPKAVTCPVGYALCEDKTCRADCGITSSRLLAKIGHHHRLLEDLAVTTASSCPSNYYVCPGGQCVSNSYVCPTVVSCPPSRKLCPDLSCVPLGQQCVKKSCSSGQSLCWDGKCVNNQSLCSTSTTCPNNLIKCPDGSCVATADNCPVEITCPAYSPYRCATGECRANDKECPTLITCPSNKPTQCTDGSCVAGPKSCIEKAQLRKCESGLILCPDGSCAKGKLLCPQIASCNPSQIRCWDNSCVNSISECDLLESTRDICPKLRCPDGSCRASLPDCPTQLICPMERGVKCDDGTCRQSVSECATGTECGYGLKRCPDGSCTSNENLCGTPVTCSTDAPYICFDSTCKKDPRDCPSPPECSSDSPILCPDGTCTSQRVNCKKLAKCDVTTPVRCPNMNCYKNVTYCKSIDGCPPGKVMCEDGSCATYVSYCPSKACPDHLPLQCQDGMCVSNYSLCDGAVTGCPYSKPFKCLDGSCTHDPQLCKNETASCGSGLVLCPDGSCSSDTSNCPNMLGCPPETPLLCTTGDCIDPKKGKCSVVSCPKKTPIKCMDGTCSKSITDCPSFFTSIDLSQCANDPVGNLVPCADGRCVPSSDLCRPIFKCASGTERCGDGSCRASLALCPLNNVSCPALKPIRCSAGVCAMSKDDCPDETTNCPLSRPVKCTSTGSCVASQDNCTDASNKTILLNNCTLLNPTRCNDGRCVLNSSYCEQPKGCDSNQVKCPNGICVTNKTDCKSTCPSSLVSCPDGSCKANYSSCLADNGCPLLTPFKCSDGTCKPSPLAINGEDGCAPHLVCPDYKPYLCSNGECQGSPSQCQIQKPCPSGKNYLCPDYTCVESQNQCPQTNLCPVATPVLCGSGKCAKTAIECLSSNTMYCPDEKPILCASGQCVKYAWNCTDEDTRQGKTTSRRLLATLVGNETSGSVVCSDGSFRKSVESCAVIPSCPPGTLRCNSSECVDDIKYCKESNDLLLPCAEGTKRCLDGICRSQCLLFQGCPADRGYHCGNGFCVMNQGECAGDSVCQEGYFRCIDNQCVNDPKLCAVPLRNYLSEQLQVTVSPLKTSSIDFIPQGSTGVRLATLTIPAGALVSSTSTNTSNDTSMPQSGLLINPVAQSLIFDLSSIIDDTKYDYVDTIFPYHGGSIFFHQTVRSPIINLTALNRGDDAYKFQLVLDISADVLANTTKSSDYCLATIDGYTKTWRCVNRTLLNSDDTSSNSFSYSVPEDGVYTVVFNPVRQNNQVPAANCSWLCQNKMTILYVMLGLILFSLIAAIIIWRISRYVKKYREAKKQMANFREQIQEMEKAKTDIVGQTLRDKIEGISFTTNPAFRKESSASSKEREKKLLEMINEIHARDKVLENSNKDLTEKNQNLLEKIDDLRRQLGKDRRYAESMDIRSKERAEFE